MKLIRTVVTLVVLGGLVYCGATVKLGKRTFFQHVRNIWSSDETQELVDGVKETGGPMVDKVKRGFEAGVEEAGRDDTDDPAQKDAGAAGKAAP